MSLHAFMQFTSIVQYISLVRSLHSVFGGCRRMNGCGQPACLILCFRVRNPMLRHVQRKIDVPTVTIISTESFLVSSSIDISAKERSVANAVKESKRATQYGNERRQMHVSIRHNHVTRVWGESAPRGRRRKHVRRPAPMYSGAPAQAC